MTTRMKIRYFHRHHACGYSIFKVFHTIEREIAKENTVSDVFMPSPRSMPWDVMKNAVYAFWHRNRRGINHISGHIHDSILGLIGCRTVLTVHDLVFIDNVRNPMKRFYKWLFWLYIPIKLADKVTCISAETQRKILKHVKTDKLQVIYNPIDPAFKYTPKVFNSERPVILHIGAGWNKNLRRTILALRDVSCHLRIIGKLDRETIELLKETNIDYSVAADLNDDEIIREYLHCDIVNFPSVYEGFGMPIIEGQKTGRVVVASRIEPLMEISGGAIEYVDPLSIDSIRKAYLHVINDQEHRDLLIQKGLENVKRFEATVIAKQYNDIYRQLISRR